MRLLLNWNNDEPIILPINYNHILQGIIYKAMTNNESYTQYLHDEALHYGKRNYKPFTFSMLKGRYEYKNKKLTFTSHMSFEIRSPDAALIKLLASSFYHNGITFGKVHVVDIQLMLFNDTVEDRDLIIKMKSPIIIYSTDPETHHTYFPTPNEEAFAGMISDNFIRKYIAYYGVEPTSNIFIEPVKITQKDHTVTDFKGMHLSCWYGIYHLAGLRKHLDFLYNIGLGSKNGAGFGMFDVENGYMDD